jgi:hypothetical protein
VRTTSNGIPYQSKTSLISNLRGTGCQLRPITLWLSGRHHVLYIKQAIEMIATNRTQNYYIPCDSEGIETPGADWHITIAEAVNDAVRLNHIAPDGEIPPVPNDKEQPDAEV